MTALTKDARGISAAAQSLATLEAGSSPTDQLAAIFKFMKSLDPTSVVREGEQQMARSTGGPADAFIGYINQAQGEGGLTPTAFSNMVETARNLANSASETSSKEVGGYLAVLENKIEQEDLEKLRARTPEKILTRDE